MQRRAQAFLVGILFLLPVGVQAVSPQADKAQQELKSLQDRIANVKTDLHSAQRNHSQAHQQLKQAEQGIGKLSRSIRSTQQAIKNQTRKLQSLHVKLSASKEELADRQRLLAQQVRAAYMMGRQQRIKLLLNQQRPETLSRMSIYFDYLARARADSVRETNRMVSQLDVLVAQGRREEHRLAQLRDEKVSARSALGQSRIERERAVSALARKIKTDKHRLTELGANEAQLKQLLKKLKAAVAEFPGANLAGKPFKSLRGKMHWPTKGRLTARFGARRSASSQRWEGVVITAPSGATVRAISDGRVVFADWLRGFGLLTIVDHGQGYMSLYAHNQSLLHEVGDPVTAGEPLASVGNSGGQKIDGLYFEIRHKGEPVNPTKWCRKRSNRG